MREELPRRQTAVHDGPDWNPAPPTPEPASSSQTVDPPTAVDTGTEQEAVASSEPPAPKNEAEVAGPPSPRDRAFPVPAKVRITPSVPTL